MVEISWKDIVWYVVVGSCRERRVDVGEGDGVLVLFVLFYLVGGLCVCLVFVLK